MPGPAIHHMIVEKIKNQLQYSKGFSEHLSETQRTKLKDLLADPKNHPYLYLGCQGPDFFFFNTKDMPGPIGDIAEVYFEVTDFINNLVKELKELLPSEFWEMLEEIEETVDEITESSVFLSELEQTFGDINQVLTGMMETLMEAVKKFISQYDLFDLFEHPYRDGVPSGEKWWWFDALHYRKTGKFVQSLLEQTKDMDSPLHLYALGYLTHVAGDTVGHPYVNLVSGGPYRSHGQRHKTGENYQDVLNMLNYDGVDFNRSKLHALYNFNYTGTVDTENDKPDPNTSMPPDLSKLIADTINQVFDLDGNPGAEFGSAIDADDVNNTYRLWFKWFKSTTESGTLPEPTPYSFSAELREVWEKAKDNLGDIGDFVEDAADTAGDFGILGLFIFLAALIIAALATAAAIADAIAGGLLTMGTSTIRAAASLMYEQIYNAFQNFRLGVALNGLAFPMKEHMSDSILAQYGRPNIPDPRNKTAYNYYGSMPLLRWDDHPDDYLEAMTEDELGLEDHLIYPITGSELKSVFAGLPSYLDKDSMFYVAGKIPFTEGVLDKLVALGDLEVDELEFEKKLAKRFSLGNAMELSSRLYDQWKSGKRIPDFNLDADRGYGYLCWSQVSESGVTNDQEFPNPLDVDNTDGIPVQLKFLKNE
ncbi:zinc dependent phospholipase C family protein [Galbibacter mesophilus]|uniref:zinc dependent phospholipase C family protein n=1 Tax=Galbibacter mesophilus TaxID=379069 RepID=UPI00191E284B|nr:zinc dependent phospholipase C family protein [Galbibacter mesophilus]MCM5663645.1 zinc dependent phospholipase C family protein [Galbibacter mesophilus]